eukprot:CAMPEP_0206429918 /NCGR_PEP_ID=MMETSP0324_2-20121206/6516_1 /ASSEMBLY_ACC=CAM_ASM_000836 /TAXON_ID=2866 /ORGANISM="Crypthecodinium cohnii, Strain Seligo" /LENGTH=263 /DNA_ID=CAMNT_0053895669 /DNA_START=81 /DNA_END=872 /DNA_ORIENTATION=+
MEDDSSLQDDPSFYQSLASEELRLEVLQSDADSQKKDSKPETEGNLPKRRRLVDDFDRIPESDEESEAEIVLCDGSPNAGRMEYYLGRAWEKNGRGHTRNGKAANPAVTATTTGMNGTKPPETPAETSTLGTLLQPLEPEDDQGKPEAVGTIVPFTGSAPATSSSPQQQQAVPSTQDLAKAAANIDGSVDEEMEAVLSQIEFHMDFSQMADTPWRQVGGSLQDHFNFDLDERSLKEYLLKQVRIRLEAARNHGKRSSGERRSL